MHALNTAFLRLVGRLERRAATGGQATVVAASSLWESVDAALGNKCCVGSDPWLVGVDVLESVLLLVLPLHVTLFVEDRVPPDIKQSVGPGATANEEGTKVEAAAVLGNDQVDAFWDAVTYCARGEWVEVVLVLWSVLVARGTVWRVLDLKRVVDVDVTVGSVAQVVEDVLL